MRFGGIPWGIDYLQGCSLLPKEEFRPRRVVPEVAKVSFPRYLSDHHRSEVSQLGVAFEFDENRPC